MKLYKLKLNDPMPSVLSCFLNDQTSASPCLTHHTFKLCKLYKLYKWCHLMAKFGTNASGAIWWPNLELIQVALSGGQIWN